MIVLILASSVCLTLDTLYLDPDSKLARVLYGLDIVWTSTFVIEVSSATVTGSPSLGEVG